MSAPNTLKTTCPYCGVGCGIEAQVIDGEVVSVEGDGSHPANLGRLCIKGSSVHETLGERGRLLQPRVDGRPVGWDQALDSLAGRLRQVITDRGPEAVGFYLSGQLLTEDYYVANKLAKGFIGTPHVDTNSRLCMSSAVASYKRAFGADAVPGCYEDLELADLLVLVGSNAAWNHPVLYQRMKQSARNRPGRRLVVIDPRRTASCEEADLHLPLRPGTDAILFNGLLVYLADQEAIAREWVEHHTRGLEAAIAAARRSAPDCASVARQCDLPEADVRRFYDWFARTPRSLSFYSQGVNQSENGTDQGNAIINVHLATGRVGQPGASPFSITGQPNAMGGREVGGLSNQLAAHMDYDTPGARERVQAFWQAPGLPEGPGLKAVDLFEAVHDGHIRAIWIMATNPVVSLPDADRVRAALERCPLVIVSDCYADTDTLRLADIHLPAAGWSEKDGTVTNSERRISRQRGLLPPPGEARPDWWIMTALARRLGFGRAFPYESPHEIFREHARLSGLDNAGSRAFDISAVAAMDRAAYNGMAPVQWPCNRDHPRGRARLYGEGGFHTVDGLARFVPVHTAPLGKETREEPVLNTGRLRDQWHTMTRTGRAPRLLQHQAEPGISVHPGDARHYGVEEGDLARLETAQGTLLARVRLDSGQRPGELFVPIHWTDQFSARARVGALIPPVTDPLSGQPAFKKTAVRLSRWPARWHGLLLRRRDGPLADAPGYWSRYPLAGATAWRLADTGPATPEQLETWLGGEPQICLEDRAAGVYRAARLDGDRLEAVLFLGPRPEFPETGWLAGLFREGALSQPERRALLAGRPAGQEDTGPVVCSCHQVGENSIRQAIARGCATVEGLGKELRCGTNCGSCVPEIRALLGD